ncbi:MAG: UvrD-helicase domain-containing protein [Oligoflexia bacterium]|nr:UvrD-helicase domain-containing protein [Oligoflexia bacterium]
MSSTSPLITTIVEAGAGTGKTESLARRIIEIATYLYNQNKRVPRLVATTFTERATAELRERVVSILSKEKNPPSWLVHFVQDTEKLHISTIHGTLSLILHRFGMLLGLDPEFVILNGPEEREIVQKVLRSIISQKPEYGILLEQYSFSELISIVCDLMAHRQTYGNDFKSATGWEDIAKKDISSLKDHLKFLCTADISKLSDKLGEKISELQSLWLILDKTADDYVVVREKFLNVVGEMSKPAIRVGAKGSEFKESIDFIFELKKEKWAELSYDPEINKNHDELAKLISDLVALSINQVFEEKRTQGALSFDDLEFLTFELIEKHPQVVSSVRKEWDFWFVDEYQDTSPLQKKLLFELFRKPWNSYFVGDPQQSIYLFRGADENVFQDTKKIVKEAHGLVERLEVNYRSHPDLLKFMNMLFTSLNPPMNNLVAKGPEEGGIRTHVQFAENLATEEDLITRQVLDWQIQGHAFHEMAVLVKTNDKARLVASTLADAGIPVYIHSTGGYYDRREVLDALAVLSFIEDSSDDDAFILIARSPWIGIPDTVLARWGHERESKSFWHWLESNNLEIEKYPSLLDLRNAVEKVETWPLSVAFDEILNRLGFFEFCLIGDVSGRREANLRKLVSSLRQEERSPGFSATVFIKRAWSDLEQTNEESEAASFIEPQRVNIMTIHKSKGLKFNCVVVPYCSDPLRPKSNLLELSSDGKWAVKVLSPEAEEKVAPIMHHVLKEERYKRELAESLRVFYVAVTRAAEKLSLIAKSKVVEKSWFSKVSLFNGPSISQGVQENTYSVKVWSEPLEISKAKENIKSSADIKLKLPESSQEKIKRLTVSEALGGAYGLPQSQEKLPLKAQLESQQRGLALHALFEFLKTNPDANLDELISTISQRFITSWKINSKAVQKTLEIKQPPLKELISKGFSEWPFLITEGGVILEGQIDLWGIVDEVVWVCDYKSAKNISDDALERARAQLELYALAVNRAGASWDKIKLAVIAPLDGRAYIFEPREKKEVIIGLVDRHLARQVQSVSQAPHLQSEMTLGKN